MIMYKMKDIAGLYALGAFIARDDVPPVKGLKTLKESKRETPKERQKRFEENQIRKGLKPFSYNDKTIWALNQKNADRKAKKQGLI